MTTLVRTQSHKQTLAAIPARKGDVSRLYRQLVALCDEVGPNGRIPRHTELMTRFGASQHHVLKCLDELVRQGRIVRRHGSGTFVTDSPLSTDDALAVASKTVVVLSMPDGAVIDRCVQTLYSQAIASGVEIVCRFLTPDRIDSFDVSEFGNPLGFVVFRRNLAPIARKLYASGQRVVIVGAPIVGETYGVPAVCGNQDHGGYLIANHLIGLGHRYIAYLDEAGWLENQLRWRGHSKALRAAAASGVDVETSMIDGPTWKSWLADPSLAAKAVRTHGAATAIVAWNDQEALTLLGVLSRAGVSVPDEVSVVGYDNQPEGERVHPSLTTVDHLIGMQGGAAMDLLLDSSDLQSNYLAVFSPTLVVRESTGTPRT